MAKINESTKKNAEGARLKTRTNSTYSSTKKGHTSKSASSDTSFDLIRQFCDSVDALNFYRVDHPSEEMQSSVTDSIQGLEERLGMQLLDRSKRPFQLTPEGERYYDDCRAILDREADAVPPGDMPDLSQRIRNRITHTIRQLTHAKSGVLSNCIPFVSLTYDDDVIYDAFPATTWDVFRSAVKRVVSHNSGERVLVGFWHLDADEKAFGPLDTVQESLASVMKAGELPSICVSESFIVTCWDASDGILGPAAARIVCEEARNEIGEFDTELLSSFRAAAFQGALAKADSVAPTDWERPYDSIFALFQKPAKDDKTAQIWHDWCVARGIVANVKTHDLKVDEASELLRSASLSSDLSDAVLIVTDELQLLRDRVRDSHSAGPAESPHASSQEKPTVSLSAALDRIHALANASTEMLTASKSELNDILRQHKGERFESHKQLTRLVEDLQTVTKRTGFKLVMAQSIGKVAKNARVTVSSEGVTKKLRNGRMAAFTTGDSDDSARRASLLPIYFV